MCADINYFACGLRSLANYEYSIPVVAWQQSINESMRRYFSTCFPGKPYKVISDQHLLLRCENLMTTDYNIIIQTFFTNHTLIGT